MRDDQRQALSLVNGLPATPNNLTKIAKVVGDDLARWAFLQDDLRVRARAKFSLAPEMLFTREALEQATTEGLAAFHASCFPAGSKVADLSCGIGADLIALSRRGPTVGFDLDAERLEYAAHNLAVAGVTAELRNEDSLQADWDFDYAYVDPARRVEGRRTLDLAEFSPNPLGMAEKMAALRLGLVKMSPMLGDDDLRSLSKGVRFVSFDGECREALLFNGLDSPDNWGCIHAESGEFLSTEPAPRITDEAAEYFYEADPAAIRAHSIRALCEKFGLSALGESNGYLTGSVKVVSPWLKGYRVIQTGRGDLKTTRKILQGLGSKTPVLKQRGTKLDLAKLVKEMRLEGSLPLIVAIWKSGESVRHTIIESL